MDAKCRLTTPCVLVPAYNSEASIGAVVEGIASRGLPVLVIDDGSTDGTAAVARRAGAEVISHPGNLGKGEALRSGWRAARERGYSHAITMDADGQHLASDLPAFLTGIEEDPDAILVGDRPMHGPNVPRSSRVGRAVSDFMLVAAAALELVGARPDTQCGYRAYPLTHVLSLPLRGHRFEMEMEVLVQAAWHRVPIVAVPIQVHYAAAGERLSHFHKWADNVRIVGIYTRLMLIRLFWPLLRPRRRLLPPR